MRVLRKKERNRVVKNWKAKLSMLMVLCLILTGSHGLVLSADAQEEQGGSSENKIVLEGNQVNIRLRGEDLRRAAEETLQTEKPYDALSVQAYSKNAALMEQYRKIFSDDAEIYEIPLEKIEAGLEAELFSLDGNVHVFVEKQRRDNQGKEVQKKKKDSLLLFDTESDFRKEFQRLYPELIHFSKGMSLEEALSLDDMLPEGERVSASDLEKENYKLTGEEILTFVYENAGEEPLSFQLQVEDNRYPIVTVQERGKILSSLEKEGEAKFPKKKSAESSTALVDNIDDIATPEAGRAQGPVGAEVGTENADASTTEEQAENQETTTTEQAGEAGQTVEEGTAQASGAEAQGVEENAQSIATGVLTADNVVEGEAAFSFAGLDLSKVRTAGYVQYSINELGRQSQFKEVKGFGTVEVFYEKDAFSVPVKMEAKLMRKPEEASGSELNRLSDKQIERIQEKGIYDNSLFVDIHFKEKGGSGKEVEPTKAVGVRISVDGEFIPKEVQAEEIAVYHLVEEEMDSEEIAKEKVKREMFLEGDDAPYKDFRIEEVLKAGENGNFSGEDFIGTGYTEEELGKEILDQLANRPEKLVKEFQVSSFSAFVLNWTAGSEVAKEAVFIPLDEDGFRITEYTWYDETEQKWKRETASGQSTTLEGDVSGKDVYLDLAERRKNNASEDYVYKVTKKIRGYGEPEVYQGLRVSGNKISFKNRVKRFVFNYSAYTGTIWMDENDVQHPLKNTAKYTEDEKEGAEVHEISVPNVFYVKYPLLSHNVILKNVAEGSGAQLKYSIPFEGFLNSNQYFAKDNPRLTLAGYRLKGFYRTQTRNSDGTVSYSNEVSKFYFPSTGANAGKTEWVTDGGVERKELTTEKTVYAVYEPDSRINKHTGWSLPQNTVYNDKYIHDNKDGSYDLTLTVEGHNSKAGQKEKLNVLFVYDISGSMNLTMNPLSGGKVSANPPYDNVLETWGKEEEIGDEKKRLNPVEPKYRRRYEYATDSIRALLRKLRNNTDLDVEYAMVTFSGNVDHTAALSVRSVAVQQQKRDIMANWDSHDNKGATIDPNKNNGPSSIVKWWTKNPQEIYNVLTDLKPYHPAGAIGRNTGYKGSTNYEAGFKKATKALNGISGQRSDAKNVVIFVTDGDPTAWINKKKNPHTDYTRILNRLYNSETGSVNPYPGNFLTGEEIGNGFDYEEEAMQQAEIALRNISKMDAFYAVGVGTEGGYSHLGRLTNPVALPVGTETKPYFKGSNPKALARAFDDIANYMTSTGITGVSIEDTLSENVDQDPAAITEVHAEVVRLETTTIQEGGRNVEVTSYSEPITDLEELEAIGLKNGLASMKVSVVPGTLDSADKAIKGTKLKLEFVDEHGNIDPNYELVPGYRYQIKAKIKPSRKAYEKYLATGYKNTGEAKTDLSDVYTWKPDKYVGKEAELNTSSRQMGWFSNDGAKVYYKPKTPVPSDWESQRPGKKPGEKEKVYQKPVLQVHPGTLVLKKRFNGLQGNNQAILAAAKNISLKVYQEKVINGVASGQQQELGTYRFYTEASRNTASPVLESYAKMQGTGNNTIYSIEIPNLMPGDNYYVEEILGTPDEEYSANNKNYIFQNWSIENGAVEANITKAGKAVKVMKATMKMGKANGQAQNTEISFSNNYQEENKQVLRIEKRVRGEMADSRKQFAFRIHLYNKKGSSITQAEFDRLKDYYFDANTRAKVQFTPAKTTGGKTADSFLSFTLAHGESLAFNLPENFQYIVGENPDGYMPYIDKTRSTVTPALKGADAQGFRMTEKTKLMKKVVSGQVKEELISFQNEKNPVPPTDVNVTAIPGFIILLGILGSGFVLVQKKRRKRF
jgi:hypothetical protein